MPYSANGCGSDFIHVCINICCGFHASNTTHYSSTCADAMPLKNSPHMAVGDLPPPQTPVNIVFACTDSPCLPLAPLHLTRRYSLLYRQRARRSKSSCCAPFFLINVLAMCGTSSRRGIFGPCSPDFRRIVPERASWPSRRYCLLLQSTREYGNWAKC